MTTPLNPPPDSHYDAIVVGARCAGAFTAMLLSRAGLRVLAVDRSAYGSDTLSTHAIMRPGVLQLARFGLLDRVMAAGTPPTTRTVFHYDDRAIDVTIEPRDGVDALCSPRRTVLDGILVDAAREAGAEVRYGVSLVGLLRSETGRVQGVRLRDEQGALHQVSADIVIGADGRHSSVARFAGVTTYRVGKHASATLYAYFSSEAFDEADANHWYFRNQSGAGLIPTNDGVHLVFVADEASRMRDALRADSAAALRAGLARAAPELLPAIASAKQIGRLQGFGGLPGYFRTAAGPGFALVGDAGYFKDPITAHGISDALRDAELLARAVARGTDQALADYARRRDELSLRFFEISDELGSFAWDAARAQQLHRELSREMKREGDVLLALGAEPFPRRKLDVARLEGLGWRSSAA